MGEILHVHDGQGGFGAAMVAVTGKTLCRLALGYHDGMKVPGIRAEIGMACQAAISHLFLFPDSRMAGRTATSGIGM